MTPMDKVRPRIKLFQTRVPGMAKIHDYLVALKNVVFQEYAIVLFDYFPF